MRQPSLGLGSTYPRRPPSPFLCFLGRWLHALALALWLGGLVILGAIVAPTVFHTLAPNRALAGEVFGNTLLIFNVCCLACGGMMILADLMLWRAWGRASVFCLIVTLGLLALTGYLGWVLFPIMDAAQAHGQAALFAQLHARYERLFLWELPPLILLAAADALRGGSP